MSPAGWSGAAVRASVLRASITNSLADIYAVDVAGRGLVKLTPADRVDDLPTIPRMAGCSRSRASAERA